MDAIRLFDSSMALFALAGTAPVFTTTTTTAAPAAATGGMPGWMLWVITLALIAGSFILANSLAKAWRMYDYTGRFFIVIFSTVIGIAIVALGWPPKLGIDLSGGQILVYSLDQARLLKTTLDENDVLAVRAALTKTLKTDNIKTPEVKLTPDKKGVIDDIQDMQLGIVDRMNQVLAGPDVLPAGRPCKRKSKRPNRSSSCCNAA
jgi:hypothetical protein